MIAFLNKEKNLFVVFAALFVLTTAAASFTGNLLIVAIPFAAILFYAGWQYKNFIFLLLLFSLPLSVEYNFSPSLGSDIPDEFLMLFTSFLFFGYWLYSPKSISMKLIQHPLVILLSILISWLMVTVIFSTYPQISVKYLLAKSWYIGAFMLAPFIVFKNKQSIATAAVALIISMMLIVVIALIKHWQYDFSFVNINDAVSPFFRNHVNYSAMLVCIVPLLWACWKLSNKREIRILLAVLMLIVLVALFLSYARGAWLALLVGIIAYYLLKRRLLFYAFIAAIIITVASLFWLKENDRYLQYAHDYKTTIFHKNFDEHLVATYKLKDVSTAERFYRWIAGVRMIKDNWLTGYGPNTFYNNYKPYGVPAYKTWVSDNPEHSTVHNYFLLTVIEQGLPGLMFLLILLGAMFYYTQHLYLRIRDLFYKTVVAAAGVILTMIMVVNFLSDLIETDKIGSLFFLCLSILIIADVNTRSESDSSPNI